MWGAEKIHFSYLPQNPKDWKDAVVASSVASFQLKWELLRKAGNVVAKVNLNLRMWFLQDISNGRREPFAGCGSGWVSEPRPAALCSWELLGALPPLQQRQRIPKLAEPLCDSPATELHKATAQGTSLDFFLEFCLELFVTEEKWKNLSDQTGLWNHPETCWIFIIAGCLELAWEWKKPSFWKTTIFCGLEGYWIFYVGNTGSLMGQ